MSIRYLFDDMCSRKTIHQKQLSDFHRSVHDLLFKIGFSAMYTNASHPCCIHIQNMKNFDNPGIFGNASTIPADSISAVNAGKSSRKCRNCRDCRRFAGIAGIVENVHILANTPCLFDCFCYL